METTMNVYKAIKNFAELNVPTGCISDDGKQYTFHWSGTKASIEAFLWRDMTDDEITILSLSRAYGPTPSLTDDEVVSIMDKLFPKGNPYGIVYEWEELLNELK